MEKARNESRFDLRTRLLFLGLTTAIVCTSVWVFATFWHYYKFNRYRMLSREEALAYGAYVADMEWRVEPEGIFAYHQFRIRELYCYRMVESASGFRGWNWVEPAKYAIGIQVEMREVPEPKYDTFKYERGWNFSMKYGGGSGCDRAFHPDSNGNLNSGGFAPGDVTLLTELTCVPNYLKFVSVDPKGSWQIGKGSDTMFVLHVWRRGLKWPDVKKLAVPNEVQEQRNREKYERWLQALTKKDIDSMDQDRKADSMRRRYNWEANERAILRRQMEDPF